MGRCYYYGKKESEIKAFEDSRQDKDINDSNEIRRIIIDDDTELVIEKDTIYEIDRKCEKCLKNKNR